MGSKDWVAQLANALEQRHETGVITVASGISPSGNVHAGNLREVMTAHFVADELRHRGREVRHLHSWDDFDRFRKVPLGIEGIDDSWENYIGRPLSDVPAPHGSAYSSWADHFKAPFLEAVTQLGVDMECISQSERYQSGVYHEQILKAMEQRVALGEIIAENQTKGERINPEDYYPYRPLCPVCGADYTTVDGWNAERSIITFTCQRCHVQHITNIATTRGKLAWKIDWPMRWAYEGVDFEPGGPDHMSPGSSWQLGELIAPMFGGVRPMGQRYSFVGFDGVAKMASSRGGAPTPLLLLSLITPEMLRWLFARAQPTQAFQVDLNAGLTRLYDEWDAFVRRCENGSAKEHDLIVYQRSISTSAGVLKSEDAVQGDIKFSALASFADITIGDQQQMTTLMEEVSTLPLDMERAQRARNWVNLYLPEDQKTSIVPEFRKDFYDSLTAEQRTAITLLVDGLDEHWEGTELTRWAFGAAKVSLGIEMDERNLSPEAKEFQREYFRNVYQLLIAKDAGPRLPQLLRCLGVQRASYLLTGVEE